MLPPKTEPFSYDADGNLTSDGLWTYTYNARNQLVAMNTRLTSGPALAAEFDLCV